MSYGPGTQRGSTSRFRKTAQPTPSPGTSCTPSHSARMGRSGTAPWGTAGESRPTAGRRGRTGNSSSSVPSGNTSRPMGSRRAATRCTSRRQTGSSCPTIVERPGPRSPILSARARRRTCGGKSRASMSTHWGPGPMAACGPATSAVSPARRTEGAAGANIRRPRGCGRSPSTPTVRHGSAPSGGCIASIRRGARGSTGVISPRSRRWRARRRASYTRRRLKASADPTALR